MAQPTVFTLQILRLGNCDLVFMRPEQQTVMQPVAALTVVLATRNRASTLSETLTYMEETDRRGLQVTFIVIDNDSQDETRAVVESCRHRLFVRYLHESRHGKNCALNAALDRETLDPLVVFTDDDVRPARDWLQKIVAVSRRWPHHSVFGGRIVPVWPMANPPAWVHDALIRQVAFAAHDLGPDERPYAITEQPFGPNFWLRREVITNGARFDVEIGPGTGSLGDEVAFLHQLQQKGLEIIYSPEPCIEHRIQAEGLSVEKLFQRAAMVGRIGPRMHGLCRLDTLKTNPWLWRLQRHIRLNQARLGLLCAKLHFHAARRVASSIPPLITIAYNLESLRIAKLASLSPQLAVK